MNYVVFDTETISLNQPFCYNIGYVLAVNGNAVVKKDFVVEQIWHNLPLFSTAYYAIKRPLYVERMRQRKTIMNKFGYICQEMARDFRKYNIEIAFAFNSPFDDKVFTFNCDWFKCNNPFDNIPIHDIRGFAHQFLVDNNFIDFCEKNQQFTESGNYSTTAETFFRFIQNDLSFNEEHTALSDSIIENEILKECVKRGACLDSDYSIKRSIERTCERTLHIKTAEQTDYYFDYQKIRINKERTEITLK